MAQAKTIWRSLERTVAPVLEIVDLPRAKQHLRVVRDEDDSYIRDLVKLAVEYAEARTRRQFSTATWVMKLDSFPNSDGSIRLPRPPLQSVSSVTYVDSNGATQTVSASTVYTADTSATPGKILLRYNQSWPSDARSVENAVTITYLAGWLSSAAVPPWLMRAKQAVLFLIEHWYNERSPAIVGQGFTAMKIPLALDLMLDSIAVPEFY